MKKIPLLTLILICFLTVQSKAQIQFGVKMGVHSFELSDPKDILFPNSEGSISFSDAKMGFQGGIYTKIKFAGVFIEPRVMLNSTQVEYVINDPDSDIINQIGQESFTNIDIPVLLGFKLLFFDAVVGPVAHINLDHSSDLFEFENYSERFETAEYGWRAGLGLGLGNIHLGVEYEGNFSEFGDHINIGGQDFSFGDTPGRLIFNLGIRLL
ncbi:MAG: outer membrane beta-barrel protein [Saprospiraceae bacterium]|nr:outer membrane beta-barrel protein [Saprospiraceae bacterium]